jgi:hypothetical protein
MHSAGMQCTGQHSAATRHAVVTRVRGAANFNLAFQIGQFIRVLTQRTGNLTFVCNYYWMGFVSH